MKIDENIDDIRRLFNFFKPKKTDEGFAGRRNNYTEYISEGDGNKNLSPEEYLDITKPYLNDSIIDHKASGEWKIQLVIQNRCISSKNYGETRNMYSMSKNIKIFMGNNTDEVIDRLFNTMLQRFQEAKETSFERGSEFIFENVDSLYYYFQKIDINRSGSYIETPKWLKDKKATNNPKNRDDDNCFQYSITIALDHKNIGKAPQRISKIKAFITKHNWKEINFLEKV